jgi:hypothetical protein
VILPALAAPRVVSIHQGRVARVHKPGDGLKYRGDDGKIVEEYRTIAELSTIVDQLPGKPVMALHPDATKENHDGIVARGAKGTKIGTIRSARLDGEYIVAEFELDDTPATRELKQRRIKELSLGYLRRLDDDRYQFGTIADHLAVTFHGNCGPSCEMRLDARHDCACEGSGNDSSTETLVTETIVFDESAGHDQGVTCKCDAMGYKSTGMDPAELKAKLDAAETEANALKARADEAVAERDALQARLDQATAETLTARTAEANAVGAANAASKERDAERLRADEAVSALESEKAKNSEIKANFDAAVAEGVKAGVAARAKLISEVVPIIGKDEKGADVDLSDKTDRQLMTEAILRIDNNDLSDEKKFPDPVVAAVFGLALPRFKSAEKSRTAIQEAIATNRQDAALTAHAPTTTKTTLPSEAEASRALRHRVATQHNTETK